MFPLQRSYCRTSPFRLLRGWAPDGSRIFGVLSCKLTRSPESLGMFEVWHFGMLRVRGSDVFMMFKV